MKQKYTLLLLFLVGTLVSCSDSGSTQSTSISGEIVNPQSAYVIISKNDRVLDTAFLNENHRFYYRFDKKMKDGFYKFRHPYDHYSETQIFYIQKGDSLQLRLNTRDFDKSLMYSGDDAMENNFLMDVFLKNRKNNKMLLRYYRMRPRAFVHRIDSIRARHLRKLRDLGMQYGFSKQYMALAKAIINYVNYDFHERYYFLVNKYNRDLKSQLPADFLAYRNHVNFNDQALQTYYLYHYFLDDYLKNKSVEDCLAQHGNHRQCYDLKSKANLQRRMALADSIFHIKSLRERFLTRFAARCIVRSQTHQAVDSIVDFLANCRFSKSKLKQIRQLAKVQEKQFIGNIGEINLKKPSGDEAKMVSILHNPTVIYYWSMNYKAHHQHLHKKIDALRKRFPKLNFIGINIDSHKTKEWLANLADFNYDKSYEYQLVCAPEQRKFYRNYLNKLVFVNPKGQIIDGDINAHDPHLEEKILGIINRKRLETALSY